MNHLQRLLYFAIWFAFSAGHASAQIKTKGFPEIDYFPPETYRADTQNWTLLQDVSGSLLAGNNRGLLEYDGVRWLLTPLPNRSVLRSLAADETGTVFWGAQGDFGYLFRQPNGSLSLQSIKAFVPEADREFEGVPNIFASTSEVIFHTLKGIYTFNRHDSTFQVIRPSGSFQLAFAAQGSIWVNEDAVGLQKLHNGKLEMAAQGAQFEGRQISLIFPYKETRLLIFAQNEKPFVYDPQTGNTEPWPTSIAEWLANGQVYSGKMIADGAYPYYLVGTLQNGLLIFDQDGNVVQHLYEENGLPANLVWAINTDRQGNIWLGLDDGIARVEVRSPLTYYPLPGLALTTAIFEGKLYAGTTQGLFVKPWREFENPLMGDKDFQPVPGTKEQAWHLQAMGKHLLFSHINSLFEIDANHKIRKIKDGYVWLTVPLPGSDTTAIAGTYQEGLWVLKKVNDQWTFSHALEGFKESARYLLVEPNGAIWVSHPFKGLFRITLSADLLKIDSLEHFTTKNGLPFDDFNFMFTDRTQLLAGTRKGIYRFNAATKQFSPDQPLNLLLETDTLVRRWAPDGNGRFWYFTNGKLGAVEQLADGSFKSHLSPLTSFKEKIVYHIEAQDGKNVWLGTPDGLYHFDPVKGIFFRQQNAKTYSARLVSIRAMGNKSTVRLPVYFAENAPPLAVELPYVNNSMEFLFGTDWLGTSQQPNGKKVEFRFRLIGYDEEWSPWGEKYAKEYTNLPEGNYRFELEIRNVHGMKGNPIAYEFSILPPWYRTWWALSLFVLLAIGSIWAIVRLNTLRLEREKLHLEKVVAERTAEVVSQKEEISQQKEEIQTQNENIIRQNAELKSLNEEKDHLIGILAHDMRNPLHQIKMMSQLMRMKKGELTAEENRDHSVIENATDHLNIMIGKILDLEALESGKVNLDLKIVPIHHLLRVVTDSFEGRAEAKNIQLRKAIAGGEHWAEVDQGYFQQVLENLISNAIKFSPTDKNVMVRLKNDQTTLRIEVQDEGPGIVEAEKDRLFGKFQKLSAKPTGGEQSTGLGLSIVKKYVETMKGKVWCESEEGQGACFIIELPARVPAAAPTEE